MQRHPEVVWKILKRKNTQDSYEDVLNNMFLQNATVHKPEEHQLLGSGILCYRGPVLAFIGVTPAGCPGFTGESSGLCFSTGCEETTKDVGFFPSTSVTPSPALFHFTVAITITQAIKTKTTCTSTLLYGSLCYSGCHQTEGTIRP